jgi:catechol-2,3-dioxygenase
MQIQDLRLETVDLERQRDFYCRRLSFAAASVTPDSFTLQIGASRLTFISAPSDAQRVYHFAFNILPRQFAEAKAWIAQRAPLLTDHSGADEFDFEAWNARALYFYDPAGNIVELIARHTLTGPPRGPFTAQSLLNVSEIGLVTDSVPDTVRLLHARLGVSIYRGTEDADFAAVGDEAGLFIVVKEGRIWFPDTDKAAAPTPVTVTVAAGSTRAIVTGPPHEVALQSRTTR